MNNKRYYKKRCLTVIAVLFLVLYVLISGGRNTYNIDGIVKNTKPEEVWNVVADFSKMRLFNPTIIDFKISADSGNHQHWKYSVIYKEKLSHWPYWINLSYANFNVKKLTKDDSKYFVVESEHKTCFFMGLYCLYSEGSFTFTALGEDTLCEEIVTYQCPPFLGRFCRREVEYQRKAIMHNLTTYFHK